MLHIIKQNVNTVSQCNHGFVFTIGSHILLISQLGILPRESLCVFFLNKLEFYVKFT